MYVGLSGKLEEAVGKVFAAADGLDHQPAPEAGRAAGSERLPSERERPPDAGAAHPEHGWERFGDERAAEGGIGAAAGDSRQVFVVGGGGVASDVDRTALGWGEVAYYGRDVVDVVVGESEEAAGEVCIAAAQVVGRLFQHEDGGAVFGG